MYISGEASEYNLYMYKTRTLEQHTRFHDNYNYMRHSCIHVL